MDEYKLIKGITALADNEVDESFKRDEITNLISGDKKFSFEYNVQMLISTNLKSIIIKHPVPYKLHKKLNKILSINK